MAISLRLAITVGLLAALTAFSSAQVPDLLNAYDAGGRSLGMGSSLEGTDPSATSGYYNPASLGYLKSGEVTASYMNLPNSRSTLSGTRSDPSFSTYGTSGSSTISAVGVAVPLKSFIKGGSAAIGLSYQIGGYMHDTANGPASGLPDAGITINNYVLQRNARTAFYTLAFGQSNAQKTASFGLGLTYAEAQIGYFESGNAVDSSGEQVPFNGADVSYTAHGIGALLGGQIIPSSAPNLSVGASVRSPIELSNTGPGGIYDRIPGRALIATSYRLDGLGGNDNYAILGAQYQYFFDGESSIAFDRSDQSVFGLGVEYDPSVSNWRIPLRVGYEAVGAGGDEFGSRNGITYGLGLRPTDGQYSIDLNWMVPQGGGMDFGISASYRFKG